MDRKQEAFGRLLTIMDELREQCPWDKKQTIESIRHLTIEETYELSDSILDGDLQALKGELGDLLLHIVFYSRIASETNDFDIKDVIDGICEKLVNRHPHIYGDVKADSADTVKENWEQIKLKEGKKSVLEGVPDSLPSMVKAYRIQDKASGVGFDWNKKEDVWSKVKEELEEFENATGEEREGEFGDLLFSLINYARFVDINPVDALDKTNRKFISRFRFLEDESKKEGKSLSDLSLEEMDVYWNKSKQME